MAKKVITFSIDVEAAGPIPGPWWMCSIGICRTEDVQIGMAIELKPLVIPGLSQIDDPGAMRVVAAGLRDFTWESSQSDAENTRRVRAHFEERGRDPKEGLLAVEAWITEQCGQDRPVLVGSPVTYDFLWIYWYWWHFLKRMPIFGFSGLDLRSYFMGSHGVDFQGTGKERYLKHYPNSYAHTHDPLDDARQQGQIWQDMVRARQARGG